MEADGSPTPLKTGADGPSVTIRQMTIDDIPAIYPLGDTLFTARIAPTAPRTWDEYEVVGFFQTDSFQLIDHFSRFYYDEGSFLPLIFNDDSIISHKKSQFVALDPASGFFFPDSISGQDEDLVLQV